MFISFKSSYLLFKSYNTKEHTIFLPCSLFQCSKHFVLNYICSFPFPSVKLIVMQKSSTNNVGDHPQNLTAI